MRVFYIFDVQDNFLDMYNETPYKLYKLFENIYITSKHNKELANRMYSQITYRYNKTFTNNFIKDKKRLDPFYKYKNNIHIISSKFDHSTISVDTHYIIVNSHQNYTTFFKDINEYSNNLFICDFENLDYFWLNKIIPKEEDLTKI